MLSTLKSVYRTVMNIGVFLSIVVFVLWLKFPVLFQDMVSLSDILYRHSNTVFHLTCRVVSFMLWLCGPTWQTILFMLIMSVLVVWQLVYLCVCVYKYVQRILMCMLIASAVIYMYNRNLFFV